MSRMVGMAWSWLSGKADRQALEADLREEFAGHLGLIEQELISQGLSKDEARQGSRARFGDVERLVRDATKIKLGGSLMLQRINLVLLVVIGGAVVWLLVQNQQISARSVQTMEQVSASLVALQTRPPAESTAPGPRRKAVYVAGLVEKPGAYEIPPEGLMLTSLIASAGGLKQGAMTVYLERNGKDGSSALSTSNLELYKDLVLGAGDVVTVSEKEDSRTSKMIKIDFVGYFSSPSKARWRQEQGATLAALIRQEAPLDPEAVSVKVERSVPAPWTATLTVAEATAESGESLKLQSGDIVTALSPKADATAKEWKRYERSERIRELVRSDKDLMYLVISRESADRMYDDDLKAGYPRGHRQLTQLRQQSDVAEGSITWRVSELLKDQIDRAAAADEVLRGLLAERDRLQEEYKGVAGPRDLVIARQLAMYSANDAVIARFDELAKGQPH